MVSDSSCQDRRKRLELPNQSGVGHLHTPKPTSKESKMQYHAKSARNKFDLYRFYMIRCLEYLNTKVSKQLDEGIVFKR